MIKKIILSISVITLFAGCQNDTNIQLTEEEKEIQQCNNIYSTNLNKRQECINNIYNKEYSNLNSSELINLIKEKEDTIVKSKEIIKSKEITITDLNNKLDKAINNLDDFQKDLLKQKNEEIDKLNKEKIKLQNDINKLNDLIVLKNTEIEKNKNQITTLISEKNTLIAQKIVLNESLNNANVQITTLTNTNNNLKNTNIALQNDINNLQNQITTLKNTNTNLQNDIDTLTSEKNTLQNDLDSANTQITNLQNDIDTLTSEKNTLQNSLDNANDTIDTLTSEKNTLQNDLNKINECFKQTTSISNIKTNVLVDIDTTAEEIQIFHNKNLLVFCSVFLGSINEHTKNNLTNIISGSKLNNQSKCAFEDKYLLNFLDTDTYNNAIFSKIVEANNKKCDKVVLRDLEIYKEDVDFGTSKEDILNLITKIKNDIEDTTKLTKWKSKFGISILDTETSDTDIKDLFNYFIIVYDNYVKLHISKF